MARPKLCGIYVLTVERGSDGPLFYVGQTVDFYTRVQQHLRALRRQDHDNTFMRRAFAKYGEPAFSFSLITEVARDRVLLAECEQVVLQNYIATFEKENVMNAMVECVTSHLGVVRSLETRVRMSEALTGKKRTPEQKEAARQRSLGRAVSPETRQKISRASKGRIKSPEHQAAWEATRFSEKRLENLRIAKKQSTYTHSEETRAKIAETLTGRKQSAELIERRVCKLRGRKQDPEAIARRVASRLRNAANG